MGKDASEDHAALCRRVETLEGQVRHLMAEVDRLSARAPAPGGGPVREKAAPGSSDTDPLVAVDLRQFKAPNLLSTIAAVSFLLAIALVLRTLVDSGTVERRVGAYAGLAYAFLLLVLGHIRYTRAHRAIPVYSVCGALLLFSIIVEGHTRFHTLSPMFAYTVLALALFTTVAFGVRHGVPSLVMVGVLGATTAGLALEFPEPTFPALAALMLLANMAVRYAIRLRHCRWLNGAVMGLTVFFWILWIIRITHGTGAGDGEYVWLPWFMPVLGICAGWYLLVAAWAGMGKVRSRGRFETSLPPMVAAFAYPACRSYAEVAGSARLTIALWVFPAAMIMVLLAFFLARVKDRPRGTAVSFILGALLLLCVSLHDTLATMPQVLITCSILGLLGMVLSTRWKSHGLRLASYLIQIYVAVLALTDGTILALGDVSVKPVGLAAMLGLAALGHYVLARGPLPKRQRAPLVDPANRFAIVLFILTLVYGFTIIRLVWYGVCSGSENPDTFQAGQSLVLLAGGILLASIAFRGRIKEFAVIATLVAILGAGKVLSYDLTHLHGVPLVVSVSAVGVAASLGAFIWKKWQGETD